MNKSLFFSGFLLTSLLGMAQPQFEWVRTPPITMTINGDNIGYTTTCDTSGNIFYAGFQDDQNPYGSEILGNVFIKKYDTSGNELFTKNFNGKANVYSMVADSQGNLIMAIGFRESVLIGNLGFLTTIQGIQHMVVKLDLQGNLMWHSMVDIPEGFVESFSAVTVDASDNVYLAYDDFNDSYVTKLTSGGVFVSTLVQNEVNTITALSIDNEGNLYTAGSCADAGATFNGVAAPQNLAYNVYIAKYDVSGNFQWVRYVEDITCAKPLVKAKSPNEVYFSSALFDGFSFGSLPTQGPNSGGEDFFVTKLDASGNFQWVREVPGIGQASVGNRNSLEIDNAGNVYFAGKTRGSVNWNSSLGTQSNGFHNDAIVLKYNPSGDVLLAKTVSGGSENRFDAVSVNPQGDIFLAGFSYGEITLDALSHDQGDERFTFLTKLSDTSLGHPEQNLQPIVLYPNPARDFIRLSGLTSDNNASLFNALGQKIKTVQLSPNQDFPVSDLSQGVYFLKGEGLPTKQFFKL